MTNLGIYELYSVVGDLCRKNNCNCVFVLFLVNLQCLASSILTGNKNNLLTTSMFAFSVLGVIDKIGDIIG